MLRSTSLLNKYNQVCADNNWHVDADQLQAVHALEALKVSSNGYRHRLSRFFRLHSAGQGVYLHGGVGRGKTSVMDLFYEMRPPPKSRYHFYAFMQHVHDELLRVERNTTVVDPLAAVVQTFSKTRLLCLDDLEVSEIGDAMLVHRLFVGMLHAGMTIVLTSNWAPEALYQGGLHYDRFFPFVSLIRRHFTVVPFDGECLQDYRRLQHQNKHVYFYPLDQQNLFQKKVADLWQGEQPSAVELFHHGRSIIVPKAVTTNGISVGYFMFAELCEAPLGASDFEKIADSFRTLCLGGIPYFDQKNQDATRRFIKLVDTLYEHRVRLVCLAADHPDRLYQSQGLPFARTASRLIEMCGLS